MSGDAMSLSPKVQMLGLLKLLRPKQWVKNGFVLAPLVFSGAFLDAGAVSHALLAVLLFCIASSATYIINDMHEVLFVFSKSLGQISYFSENPRGADQKQQVRFLKVFNAQNPNIKNYCFRSSKEVGNTTDVEVWDIPADWWFVGFGKAFYLFVSQENKYELIRNSEQCEVVFVFRDGQLESISKR
ncbi:UbiA prenyltransferase family protein [Comamonas aquatica]|uniref:hypothetical protein n=1 Tax=Comamonas aquatica TaxID=225991 RepID=UPI0021B1200F|nr:hypothetical protein [Comamonas aquatica]